MITAQRVAKAAGKHLTRAALRLRMAAGEKGAYGCPACHATVPGFFRYGEARAWGCPRCGSSPRERLMHYLLDRGTIALPPGGAVLHCAPNEGSLVERFRSGAGDYVPADIDPSRYTVPGMQRVDLMELEHEARFDRIYASHVMEHVPDDARVLSNIARSLKPGGEAWLIVPLWAKPSEDGAMDLSGRERERRFGQWDHVRQYGLDFAERIATAGLSVEVIAARDLPPGDVATMAIDDVLFRARR
ncbi:class I SAM-dependent methyltransferase [Sphingobium sufflavum]|uniref:class I SAM-dependent methyltransferase n=1 Tax=Sphingobium sufflavum TaxID=1129547 RepID=UPI001F44F18E|nr:methyltransferase domain-containing protein [Sphingobium sufflavum]MCE7797298.1 class I SAM-dependent methyltransferase [Sphingobium sufflavum]